MKRIISNHFRSMAYQEKSFDIPELKGISQTTIDEHLKLYVGYVKHTNKTLEEIEKLRKENPEDNQLLITELRHHLSFEFDGMRNHEQYFSQLEGGFHDHPENCAIKAQIEKDFGSFKEWLEEFKQAGKTRGLGWVILSYDEKADRLINNWVDLQNHGHLTGLKPVIALDMWEHSYVMDYRPSGKGDYINDFFENLNWEWIDKHFREISS